MIKRRQVFAPITDHDGVVDVEAGLELVFDILGGDVFAAGRDDDVFFAVGDAQVTVFVEFAHVPGIEPAVLQGFLVAASFLK